MRLTDTRRDFEFLQQLPGQKLIMKGNHDYWWTTANKMNAYLKAEGFDTLHILHNNSYSVEGYAICGTRGWLFDVGEPHDEKGDEPGDRPLEDEPRRRRTRAGKSWCSCITRRSTPVPAPPRSWPH